MTVSIPQRTILLCANTLLAHAHYSIDTLSKYRRLWYELTLCFQILVELAELQDQEVGDGTTSVVIVAAELLKRANELVRNKIHPTSIIGGYRIAMREVQALTTMLMIIHVKIDDQCLCSLLRAWPFHVHMRNLFRPSRMCCSSQACKYIEEHLSIDTASLGKETLLNAAKTAMSSKIVDSESDFFATMVVDAVQVGPHAECYVLHPFPCLFCPCTCRRMC
jgi:chaperonin GroEL (HSP60 family)